MVTSRIIGGLGNQMFQYAAGKALAIRSNADFEIDLYGYETYKLWNYEMGALNISASVCKNSILRHSPNRIIEIAKKVIRKIIYKTIVEQRPYHEIEAVGNKNVYLDGYFQDERYFKFCEEEIRKDFSLKNPFSREASAWEAQIAASKNAVSIVTRRGDYLNDTMGVCSAGYYNRCITDISSKMSGCVFYIFTDDREWTEKNLILPGEVHYISNVSLCAERMMLISKCRHHIIANSTFAWWGAWLGEFKDKTVYAPVPWMDNCDLDPSLGDWIRIDKSID